MVVVASSLFLQDARFTRLFLVLVVHLVIRGINIVGIAILSEYMKYVCLPHVILMFISHILLYNPMSY